MRVIFYQSARFIKRVFNCDNLLIQSIDAYLSNFQYTQSLKHLIENSDVPFLVDKIDVSLEGLRKIYSS